MPQFVVLHHECPSGVPRPSHWDFMLQQEDVLRTWVLTELPEAWQTPAPPGTTSRTATDRLSDPLLAEEIQPHRIDYLTREGQLSGDRGSVSRVDRGSYEPLLWSDCQIQVLLCGARFGGSVCLTRPHLRTCQWQLSLSTPDQPVL